MFDPHIDLGNILTLAALLLTAWRFHVSNQKSIVKLHEDNTRFLTAINTKVDIIWNWFEFHQIGRNKNEDSHTH